MIGRLLPTLRVLGFRAFNTAPITQEYIQVKVMDAIKSFNKIQPAKLTTTSKFLDLGLDSLDIVELVCAIEDSVGFDLTTEDAEKVSSVPIAFDIFYQYALKNKKIQTSSAK